MLQVGRCGLCYGEGSFSGRRWLVDSKLVGIVLQVGVGGFYMEMQWPQVAH